MHRIELDTKENAVFWRLNVFGSFYRNLYSHVKRGNENVGMKNKDGGRLGSLLFLLRHLDVYVQDLDGRRGDARDLRGGLKGRRAELLELVDHLF